MPKGTGASSGGIERDEEEEEMRGKAAGGGLLGCDNCHTGQGPNGATKCPIQWLSEPSTVFSPPLHHHLSSG